MNKYFLLSFVIGFIAVQSVESRAKASQNSATGQTIQEGDLAKKAQEIVKKADEYLTGNLPDSQHIINNVEETGQKLVNNIKVLNEQIKKGITDNKGDIDKVLKQISDNLHTASEKIQKDILGPEGQKKAAEIKDNLKKQLQSAANNVDKLVESLKPEAEKLKNDLLAAANLFLEKTSKITDELKKKVTEAKKD